MFNAAEIMVTDYFVKEKVDILEHLSSEAESIKKTLDSIVRLASSASKKLPVLMPAFQWGQNKSHILINTKFSHRIGSPGCLEVWGHEFNASDFKVTFSAIAKQNDRILNISLNIPLASRVINTGSYYKNDSVGTIVIFLEKSFPDIWMTLQPPHIKLNSLRGNVWWELAGPYKKDMEKFSRLLEARDNQEDSVYNIL